MIEKKECIVCKKEVIVINCHYSCENCHDIPHLIDED